MSLIEDDPNLTDKKFPDNPRKSFRSLFPFKVIGEVAGWQGHSPEQLKAMKDSIVLLKHLVLATRPFMKFVIDHV